MLITQVPPQQPLFVSRVETLFWFPRTRGDRPSLRSAEVQDIRVPPHTRG